MQREQERGFRRDGSDQGVSPCDISRNLMPTPGTDAVAELPQLSPGSNKSTGAGRIRVASVQPTGDLGGGPISSSRESTILTPQSTLTPSLTTSPPPNLPATPPPAPPP